MPGLREQAKADGELSMGKTAAPHRFWAVLVATLVSCVLSLRVERQARELLRDNEEMLHGQVKLHAEILRLRSELAEGPKRGRCLQAVVRGGWRKHAAMKAGARTPTRPCGVLRTLFPPNWT